MKKIETLLVDLEDVLVATDLTEARLSSKLKPVAFKYFDDVAGMQDTSTLVLRPHVETFLTEARRFFKQVTLTSKHQTNFLDAFLKQSGLEMYFEHVLPGEMLKEVAAELVQEGFYDGRKLGTDSVVLLSAAGEGELLNLAKLAKWGVDVRLGQDEEQELIVKSPKVSNFVIWAEPFHGDPDDDFLVDLLMAFSMAAEEEDKEEAAKKAGKN